MDFIDKIVYFEQYCPTCKSAECWQDEEPCNECLGQAVNEYSHKPINYTPDKKKGGKQYEKTRIFTSPCRVKQA